MSVCILHIKCQTISLYILDNMSTKKSKIFYLFKSMEPSHPSHPSPGWFHDGPTSHRCGLRLSRCGGRAGTSVKHQAGRYELDGSEHFAAVEHGKTNQKWDTLGLCQNSYWKWPMEIVDLPIKNGDFP